MHINKSQAGYIQSLCCLWFYKKHSESEIVAQQNNETWTLMTWIYRYQCFKPVKTIQKNLGGPALFFVLANIIYINTPYHIFIPWIKLQLLYFSFIIVVHGRSKLIKLELDHKNPFQQHRTTCFFSILRQMHYWSGAIQIPPKTVRGKHVPKTDKS